MNGVPIPSSYYPIFRTRFTTSNAILSQSITGIPRDSNNETTEDFPVAIPPVSPTTLIAIWATVLLPKTVRADPMHCHIRKFKH